MAGRGPFLSADGENGGGGAPEGTKPDGAGDDLDKIEGLGDKGKEAIRREREAAKAAADRAKAAEARLDALQKEKSEREAAEAKAREDEAAKKGEFEKLAADREAERDAAKADVKSLQADNDALREAINGFLDAEWQALPAEVRDAYLGADDDPLAKLRYLPKGKALAEKLAGKEPAKRGAGADPKPNGTATISDEDKRKAQAGMYSRW
ncbi:MAG: hypothetical protein KC442_10540 [Thermomicrobiales bacterium]|nr:hypothetical protein [Thermomicrobiales bacterium]